MNAQVEVVELPGSGMAPRAADRIQICQREPHPAQTLAAPPRGYTAVLHPPDCAS